MMNPVLLAYPTSNPKQIRVTAEGFMGNSEMLLPISLDTFAECWEKRCKGAMIQDAFPMLKADEREFLISGMSIKAQKRFFK
jgi:hypothetical protein